MCRTCLSCKFDAERRKSSVDLKFGSGGSGLLVEKQLCLLIQLKHEVGPCICWDQDRAPRRHPQQSGSQAGSGSGSKQKQWGQALHLVLLESQASAQLAFLLRLRSCKSQAFALRSPGIMASVPWICRWGLRKSPLRTVGMSVPRVWIQMKTFAWICEVPVDSEPTKRFQCGPRQNNACTRKLDLPAKNNAISAQIKSKPQR